MLVCWLDRAGGRGFPQAERVQGGLVLWIAASTEVGTSPLPHPIRLGSGEGKQREDKKR